MNRIRKNKDGATDYEKKMLEVTQDLWTFLMEKEVVFKITDWEPYRRAARSVDYEESIGYEMVEVKERVNAKVRRTNRSRYLGDRIKLLETKIQNLESKLERTTNPNESKVIQDEIINLKLNLKTTMSEMASLDYRLTREDSPIEIDGEVIHKSEL